MADTVIKALPSSDRNEYGKEVSVVAHPRLRFEKFFSQCEKHRWNLDQDVALPVGFQPQKVAIEVRSNKKDVAPASQSFPWSVDAS